MRGEYNSDGFYQPFLFWLNCRILVVPIVGEHVGSSHTLQVEGRDQRRPEVLCYLKSISPEERDIARSQKQAAKQNRDLSPVVSASAPR